jgi:ribonuclease R
MSKKGNRIRKPGNKNSFKGHRSPEKKAGTKVPGYARPKNADVIVSVSSNAPRGPLEVRNQCVGILRQAGMDGIVEPDAGYSLAQYGQIRVRAGQLNGAPFGMKVVCEISNPDASPGMYEGRIVEVLGDPGNSDIAMLGVIRQFGLSPEFPEPVLAAAMKYPIDLSDVEIQAEIDLGRKDLRMLKTITIDGEDAKDLDDAISIEKIPGKGFRLFVHIADVSHYVTDQSLLDIEARQRATSVYLVDRVIPMLPPRLSNGLCSLNPGVARLAMTAEMEVGFDGCIIEGSIYESIITSDARTSYKGVYSALYESNPSEEYAGLLPMLKIMRELKDILTTARKNRGSINFDFPETKVDLDKEGNPTAIYAYPINEANGIIEEFMILCNEFVATRYDAIKYPFVYRVHEEPDPVKIREFIHVAKLFGAKTGRGKPDSGMLSALMDDIAGKVYEPALSQLLLRSLAKAKYSSMNLGHFGLASDGYCHFTSPIRRYPDLYIHRIIKNDLHHKSKKAYFAKHVEEVSLHSSEMERNAMEAERASVSQKISEYMVRHIGDSFEGIISGVSRGGIFVRLPNTIEGMVPFRIMDDYFTFDERRLEARGNSSGRVFRIGESVRIIVTGADTILRRVDFALENQGGSDKVKGKVPVDAKTKKKKSEAKSPRTIKKHKKRKTKK